MTKAAAKVLVIGVDPSTLDPVELGLTPGQNALVQESIVDSGQMICVRGRKPDLEYVAVSLQRCALDDRRWSFQQELAGLDGGLDRNNAGGWRHDVFEAKLDFVPTHRGR